MGLSSKVWSITAALVLGICVVSLGSTDYYNTFSSKMSWDFKSLLLGARAVRQGLNPYDNVEITKLDSSLLPDGMKKPLPYIYPPYSLLYYLSFTGLTNEQAVIAQDSLFILAFMILTWLILANFGAGPEAAIFWLVLFLFGFGSANLGAGLFVALNAGNFAGLEVLGLWAGLLLLSRERTWPFLVIVAILSFVKMQPILLSAFVLLKPDKKKEFKTLLVFGVVFALLFILPFLFKPEWFRQYFTNMGAVQVWDSGITNPSSFALWGDLAGDKIPLLKTVIWAVWTLLIAGATMWRVSKLRWSNHRWTMIALCVLAYALVLPRFKNYSYIQLLPVFFLMGRRKPVFYVVPLLPALISPFALPHYPANYFNLFIAFAGWLYLVLTDTTL